MVSMSMEKGRLPAHKAGFTGAHVPVKKGATATLGVFAQIGLHLRRLNGLIPFEQIAGKFGYRKL
jgi:hypothetical protein